MEEEVRPERAGDGGANRPVASVVSEARVPYSAQADPGSLPAVPPLAIRARSECNPLGTEGDRDSFQLLANYMVRVELPLTPKIVGGLSVLGSVSDLFVEITGGEVKPYSRLHHRVSATTAFSLSGRNTSLEITWMPSEEGTEGLRYDCKALLTHKAPNDTGFESELLGELMSFDTPVRATHGADSHHRAILWMLSKSVCRTIRESRRATGRETKQDFPFCRPLYGDGPLDKVDLVGGTSLPHWLVQMEQVSVELHFAARASASLVSDLNEVAEATGDPDSFSRTYQMVNARGRPTRRLVAILCGLLGHFPGVSDVGDGPWLGGIDTRLCGVGTDPVEDGGAGSRECTVPLPRLTGESLSAGPSASSGCGLCGEGQSLRLVSKYGEGCSCWCSCCPTRLRDVL